MTEVRRFDGLRAADILAAARVLRDGGVVVIPTDTLYGLGASVFQDGAIQRIYSVKQRPADERLPVLLPTAADLPILAAPPPRVAWKLIDAFWPGALTLVLPAARSAPKAIAQGRGTVAVRIPASKSCLRLLEVLGEPLVGTSANVSGMPPATTASMALESLHGIDGILVDDASIRVGTPSTIIAVTDERITILRPGSVSSESIRQVVGPSLPVQEQVVAAPGIASPRSDFSKTDSRP